MKIAIINDTHFGIRNDSPFFLENSLKFFEDMFFPYLKENNITNIIHLGDLLDRRKFVNFSTLSQVRQRFFEPLKNINMHIVVGNHDTYYKNTNKLNSITELFKDFGANINIIENPTKVDFDGLCVGLVPWISKDNEDDCLKFIQKCDCPILMGHFEIMGFQVINGVIHHQGITEKEFKRFELVLSGHFHLKQCGNNILYLGTQYELNYGDVNSQKGFHVFDTSTREVTFIENPNKMFHVIKYDDSTDKIDVLIKSDLSKYNNCFVKVVVGNKSKPFTFDKFMDDLYDVGPHDISIVEDYQEKINEITIDITEDTLSIINKEIDSLDKVQDKSKLKVIIKELYMESLTL